MNLYLKLSVFVLLIVSSTTVFAQQFYYSNKKKVILVEDTTTLIIKSKESKITLFTSLPLGGIQSIDTLQPNGIISLKLKENIKRKEVLSALRELKTITYSWHFLQLSNTFIIPTGEILLKPKEGVNLNTILSKTGTNDNVHLTGTDKYGVITLNIIDDDNLFVTANTIYESGLVDWCHPNFWLPIKHTTNDPLYADQWHLKNTGQFSGTSGIDINIENAWAITTGSSSIKIAVIDDGVEEHEDIYGRVLSGYTPRNASTGLGLPTSSGAHGEACAGIIAATQDNNIGITGIAPNCKIVPVNIFYDNNETTSDLANAINWAWDNGQADVLSNSWNFTDINATADNIAQAITNARTYGRSGKGSIVVFSSGNDFEGVHFPARANGVITVGAIDNNGNLHGYSNTGPSMDLVAPSGSAHFGSLALNNPLDGIRTTDRMGSNGYTSGNYVSFNGTSAACPQISGVAALILSANPNLTENQVTSILQTTATDMGTTGFDNSFGFGRVNACAAVYQALGTTLSITGPSTLCDSATYYINNLPTGATVSWSISGSGAEILSYTNNSVKVGHTDYGSFKIKATVSTACGEIIVLSNSIDAGAYLLAVITDISNDGMGTSYGVLCSNTPGYDNYYNTFTYDIPVAINYPITLRYMLFDNNGLYYQNSKTIYSSSGGVFLPNNLPLGNYSLDIVLDGGTCNEYSEMYEAGFEVVNCGYSARYITYPNPSSTELNIIYSPTNEKAQSSKQTATVKTTFSVKLFNDKGKVLKQGQSKQRNQIILPVADVPNGTYYLHIFEGKKVSKQQVIIKH